VENGIIFMCAAKPDFKTQPCFAFLTEVNTSLVFLFFSSLFYHFLAEVDF